MIQQHLQQLQQQGITKLAQQIRRGIEKEALRITQDGYLSEKFHPKALGSKLTHPHITTDYSEALLELITPAVQSHQELQTWLDQLHAWTTQHIADEILWSASMPCHLTGEADIPIADYGSSNIGQMKSIYRRGLAHRYGKNMQTIAGLHFNISFPDSFWQALNHQQLPLQTFVDQQSMGTIRNFLRIEPLVLYLFGASPAVCQSFDKNNHLQLASLSGKTLYGPYATSLRMSDIGYQNNVQSSLRVSYNSLEQYINDLAYATSHPEARYQAFGVNVNGVYEQLSDCILQIEAEYYGPIRPKRNTQSGERPIKALKERGIEYFEIRALDINPYSPHGISLEQMQVLEIIMLYCILTESPALTESELQRIKHNNQQTVVKGRDLQTRLLDSNDNPLSFEQWTHRFWDDLSAVAIYLDSGCKAKTYQQALLQALNQIKNPEQSLSAKVISDIQEKYQNCYFNFAMAQSKEHQQRYKDYPLSAEFIAEQTQLATKSLQEQKTIEQQDAITLAEQIAQYYAL